MANLESAKHDLAVALAAHHRLDLPAAKCTCSDGHEVVKLGELYSKHLVEIVLQMGWRPPE